MSYPARAKGLGKYGLVVKGVWHVKYCGGCLYLSIKEWAWLVWPIRNRDIITCSSFDFLEAGLHSPSVGFIWKSLLLMLLFHFLWKNLLIWGFKSVYGMEILSGLDLRPIWKLSQLFHFRSLRCGSVSNTYRITNVV